MVYCPASIWPLQLVFDFYRWNECPISSYLRNGGKVVFVFFYEIDAILYRNGSKRRKGATVAETVGDQDEWHPEIPDSGRGGQGKQTPGYRGGYSGTVSVDGLPLLIKFRETP